MVARVFASLVPALALVTACAAPSPVPGGGVRGSFDGTLHVTVIDEGSSVPLVDAVVFVDGTEVGSTDGTGQLSVEVDSADRVEARLEGYATTAFVGADAEVVTLPMRRVVGVEIAMIQGQLAAFEDLEPPAGGVVRARIGRLQRGLVDATLPVATCESPGPCTFAATVPTGRVQLFAQIDAVEPGPTEVPDDDIFTPLSFGLSEPVTLLSGEELRDVRVERFADSALTTVEVERASPGSGIDAVVGVPGIGLPQGAMVFFASPNQRSYALPQPTGVLAEASYWTITAAEGEVAPGVDGRSVTVTREPRGTVSEELTAPATGTLPALRREGGEWVASGIGEASLWEVRTDQFRAVVFDGRDRVEGPEGTARVIAWVAPPADDGWDLADVERRFTERSSSGAVP